MSNNDVAYFQYDFKMFISINSAPRGLISVTRRGRRTSKWVLLDANIDKIRLLFMTEKGELWIVWCRKQWNEWNKELVGVEEEVFCVYRGNVSTRSLCFYCLWDAVEFGRKKKKTLYCFRQLQILNFRFITENRGNYVKSRAFSARSAGN